MQGHNTGARRGGQFWKRDRRDRRGPGEANRISIATLKIRSGRVGGLEAALQALQVLQALKQGNVKVGVLQEKNITDRIHTRQVEG